MFPEDVAQYIPDLARAAFSRGGGHSRVDEIAASFAGQTADQVRSAADSAARPMDGLSEVRQMLEKAAVTEEPSAFQRLMRGFSAGLLQSPFAHNRAMGAAMGAAMGDPEESARRKMSIQAQALNMVQAQINIRHAVEQERMDRKYGDAARQAELDKSRADAAKAKFDAENAPAKFAADMAHDSAVVDATLSGQAAANRRAEESNETRRDIARLGEELAREKLNVQKAENASKAQARIAQAGYRLANMARLATTGGKRSVDAYKKAEAAARRLFTFNSNAASMENRYGTMTAAERASESGKDLARAIAIQKEMAARAEEELADLESKADPLVTGSTK